MIVIDISAHSGHVQVSRCDIKPGSVDLKNGTILGRIQGVIHLGPIYNSALYFSIAFLK
jgi:hypothetical protein